MSAEVGHPESLLVVRLGALGDIVHTLSAVASLRSALPHARIGWIVEERWAELLCAKGERRSGPRTRLRPLVDFVHVVDTKRWRENPLARATRQQVRAMRRELADQQYELAVDFQGAIKSAILARFAKQIAGMNNPREKPARWFYARRIATTGAHVIQQYHSLAESVAGQSLPMQAPIFPEDDSAKTSVTAMLPVGPFALINPGAGWGAKQWPAERYGEVAARLAKNGVAPLINFGPGEETLANQVKIASGGKAIPVSCSISELIALTRRAALFIGGDTGPMHIAAALQLPVVAIFGPTDPARNGPFGTKSIVLRNALSHTSLSHVDKTDPGLLNITVEEVTAAALKLLEEAHA